jgi:hypothetical protein
MKIKSSDSAYQTNLMLAFKAPICKNEEFCIFRKKKDHECVLIYFFLFPGLIISTQYSYPVVGIAGYHSVGSSSIPGMGNFNHDDFLRNTIKIFISMLIRFSSSVTKGYGSFLNVIITHKLW